MSDFHPRDDFSKGSLPLVTQYPLAWVHLWLFWSRFIHFAEQVLQLGPMSHELMVHTVGFVQKCVDVRNGLDQKDRHLKEALYSLISPSMALTASHL